MIVKISLGSLSNQNETSHDLRLDIHVTLINAKKIFDIHI